MEVGNDLLLVDPDALTVNVTPYTTTLGKAVNRFREALRPSSSAVQLPCTASPHLPGDGSSDAAQLARLTKLTVVVQDPDTAASFGIDESYTLQVEAGDASIGSPTAVGALWGLETLVQLVASCSDAAHKGQLVIHAVKIRDAPRFPHRGLLLDTSRHFLPVANLMAHLDGMAMNKMNVLHWHIVDDQSFPLVSEALPRLSTSGAFSQALRYNATEVKNVVEYAAERGVRVMVEVDTPGHTLSWGEGYPELLSECFDSSGNSTGRRGPLDVTRKETYEAVQKVLAEAAGWFPDAFMHLGGDEVHFSCWKSNPAMARFMVKHGLETYQALEVWYVGRLLEIAAGLNRTAVLWQEMFDDGLRPVDPTSAVFHVWKLDLADVQVEPRRRRLNGVAARHAPGDADAAGQGRRRGVRGAAAGKLWGGRRLKATAETKGTGYLTEMERITSQGFSVLLSAPWYLDHIQYGEQWLEYYLVEPLDFAGAAGAAGKLVLGGEACLWGEYVDATNSLSRAWPSSSATAERLWSARDVRDVRSARVRLSVQRCRMVARGVGAQPLVPGFCPGSLSY